MKATAKANTNIALIKYWGKRDEKLALPMNSSISITLDKFYTVTTVEFLEELKEDSLVFNGEVGSALDVKKCSDFLDIIRDIYGKRLYANIASTNYVPTAAGFASSASGFAALSAAAVKALNMDISMEKLSAIARRGSGSASRSIYGGFVQWNMGVREDGEDSVAVQLLEENEWNVTILSVMVDTLTKKVSSREGMKRTVDTSPFYKGWLETIEEDIIEAKEAIRDKDFYRLGEVMEANALKMHATMLGAKPPVIYFDHGTMEVIHCIHDLRSNGIGAYITVDAGANVKVLCLPESEELIINRLKQLNSVLDVITCHPGEGISYL